MSIKVIKKPPSKQTRAEKLQNLKAARAAKAKKGLKRRRSVAKISYNPKRAKKRRTTTSRRKKTMARQSLYSRKLRLEQYPQFLSGRILQTSNDATTSASFPLPINRLPTTPNTSIVVEVLKVWIVISDFGLAGVAHVKKTQEVAFSTKYYGTSPVGFDAPDIFAYFDRIHVHVFNAGGTYESHYSDLIEFNCTDENGNGILVATDTFNVQVRSSQTAQLTDCKFKVLYRFVRVGLAEYIGIVQSQQG